MTEEAIPFYLGPKTMEQDKTERLYMSKALELAQRAFALREVPIGCVIVRDGRIIAAAFNQRNTAGNPLHHAEIIAINKASRLLGDWRLEDCTIYVTIEPCPMCAGAILQARIPRLVYGAANPKAGAAGSVINLLDNPAFNHRAQIIGGVLAEDCAELMTRFFRDFR